jgi:hypothetical protein
MRKNFIYWLVCVCAVNALLLLGGAGCSTPPEQSYNQDFNQELAVNPKYSVQNVSDDMFKIRVRQSSPVAGPSRVTLVKEATTIIAEREAKNRGWKNWKVDYIQESDQGWMHFVVVEVWKQKAIETPEPKEQ